MANVECIDPIRLGKEVSGLRELSSDEYIEKFAWDAGYLKEVRLHWYSCPFCRATFPEADGILNSVGREIKRWAMGILAQICQKHFEKENLPHRVGGERREFFAEKLASLVAHGDEFHGEQWQLHESDVQWALGYAVDGIPDFTVRCDEANEASQRIPLTQCSEFILSLEPKAQSFVFESVLCHEMYHQLYRKAFRKTQDTLITVEPETGRLSPIDNDDYEHPYDRDFIHATIKNAFLASDIPPELAHDSVVAAASEYLRRFRSKIGGTHSGEGASSIFIDELKSEIADSFDSLKAGQNELLRLIDQNSRPASAFEPDIEMRLGDVYRRLEQKTQRLLQIAEYLYDINKSEPSFFHGPVLMLSSAYENELSVRIIGRYVLHLLEGGTKTHYCDDMTTKPLVDRGKPANLTLGNMCWYLNRDKQLREWVAKLGFASVDAISKEAGWLVGIRNRAAHESVLERAVADEVRGRMLRSDGMLARLLLS